MTNMEHTIYLKSLFFEVKGDLLGLKTSDWKDCIADYFHNLINCYHIFWLCTCTICLILPAFLALSICC